MDTFKDFLEITTPNYMKPAYQQAINKGKDFENIMTKALHTDCGFSLIPANSNDDMFRATDAFLIKDGNKVPVQLKHRTSIHSDIGYEIAKDFNENDPHNPPKPTILLNKLNGRDMKKGSKLTVNLDNTGTSFRIFDTNEAYPLIMAAVNNWLNFIQKVPNLNKSKWIDPNSTQLIMKYDLRDSYWKIIAYIPIKEFKTMQICNLKRSIY